MLSCYPRDSKLLKGAWRPPWRQTSGGRVAQEREEARVVDRVAVQRVRNGEFASGHSNTGALAQRHCGCSIEDTDATRPPPGSHQATRGRLPRPGLVSDATEVVVWVGVGQSLASGPDSCDSCASGSPTRLRCFLLVQMLRPESRLDRWVPAVLFINHTLVREVWDTLEQLDGPVWSGDIAGPGWPGSRQGGDSRWSSRRMLDVHIVSRVAGAVPERCVLAGTSGSTISRAWYVHTRAVLPARSSQILYMQVHTVNCAAPAQAVADNASCLL
jgi:hypothetical protein